MKDEFRGGVPSMRSASILGFVSLVVQVRPGAGAPTFPSGRHCDIKKS
jgi:hypothetical protein